MSYARSFPPLEPAQARILILGSMPGQASLDAQQYYAHPRNAFWKIMASIVGFDATAPYAARVDALRQAGVAVWDVLQSCYRPGSLDADIDPASIEVNDFLSLFSRHSLEAVFFNGATAETTFRRRVLPQLPENMIPSQQYRLPSSSPAHAVLSAEQKLATWQQLISPCLNQIAE